MESLAGAGGMEKRSANQAAKESQRKVFHSIASSEIPKRAPFLKPFNVRTNLFCCFDEKRLTINLEEKVDRLKIFIRTNYVGDIYLRTVCNKSHSTGKGQ